MTWTAFGDVLRTFTKPQRLDCKSAAADTEGRTGVRQKTLCTAKERTSQVVRIDPFSVCTGVGPASLHSLLSNPVADFHSSRFLQQSLDLNNIEVSP